jgi:hypothetical protein
MHVAATPVNHHGHQVEVRVLFIIVQEQVAPEPGTLRLHLSSSPSWHLFLCTQIA